MPKVLFPPTGLAHRLCDGYAACGEAVQDGDADLDLRDLAVDVPWHEPLARQLHAMHLRLDAAPAVVSTSSSPERTAKVFRGEQGLVSGHGSSGDNLPRLRILAGRDESVSGSKGDGTMAFACVAAVVCRDAADLLVLRDLVEKVGQYWRVIDMAPGDLDNSDLQCFLINHKMYLAPEAAFRATMLAHMRLECGVVQCRSKVADSGPVVSTKGSFFVWLIQTQGRTMTLPNVQNSARLVGRLCIVGGYPTARA